MIACCLLWQKAVARGEVPYSHPSVYPQDKPNDKKRSLSDESWMKTDKLRMTWKILYYLHIRHKIHFVKSLYFYSFYTFQYFIFQFFLRSYFMFSLQPSVCSSSLWCFAFFQLSSLRSVTSSISPFSSALTYFSLLFQTYLSPQCTHSFTLSLNKPFVHMSLRPGSTECCQQLALSWRMLRERECSSLACRLQRIYTRVYNVNTW